MIVAKNFRGFTLVEMMIAVLIGAILSTAAYQVLVSQSRVHEVQEQTIDMQQNVRAALDFMCRELRLAGFGMADDLDATTNVFSTLINNDTFFAGIDDNTDSITFTGNTDYGSIIIDAPEGGVTVDVVPAPNPNMEFQNSVVDIIFEQDGIKTKLNTGTVTLTGSAYGNPTTVPVTPTTLTLDTTINTANFSSLPAEGCYLTVQPTTITYRVNNNILQRDNGGGFQDLIENVEDLQFVYAFDNDFANGIDTDGAGNIIWAVDTDGDDFLDTQVDADGNTTSPIPQPDPWDGPGWAGTVDISGDSGNSCPIRAVKVSILVRSARQNPDPRFRSQYLRPRVEDHPGATAGQEDGLRRRLLHSVVMFRNLALGGGGP